MKREEFLKLISTGTLGLLLGTPLIGNAFTVEELKDGSNFDVLIVGTGYGAAVTALRLAQVGKRCLMLEMGLDWQKSGMKFSGMAWAKKTSTWLKRKTIAPFANYRTIDKFTGALDRIDFDNVKVYAGRGVGGGSLVNGGMSVTPRRDYFEEIFPELDAEKFYNTYFPKANKTLGVHTIPEDFYNTTPYYQFSRTGEEEGKAAGYTPVKVPNVYDYEYMQKEEKGEVPKSALGGEVIYGNNYGKKDLTKTYLKEALETGNVSILGLHKVEQILEESNGRYSVVVSQINTKGKTIETKRFFTSKLFLGAGSLGTTELLLKSKAKGTLKNLDATVGDYWGNNGNTMIARAGVKKSLGAKQSTMPAAGLEKWTKKDDAIFAEIAPFPVGIDLGTALYLVINRVPKLGKFTFNKKKGKLKLDWGKKHNAHMVRNAGDFLDTMNEVNGGRRGKMIFSKGIDETICYHPLGGCVLGKATDMHGRLNNYKGIYITDGALIPGTIGVNPYVTITALAEYCIEDVIAKDFKIADVSVKESIVSVSTAPNPFTEYLDIEFESFTDTTVKAYIYNWAKDKVASTKFKVTKGMVKYRWKDLGFLWKENYTLKLYVDDHLITKKITKKENN